MLEIEQLEDVALSALKDHARATSNYHLMLRCYEELLNRNPENVHFLDNCVYSAVMSQNWDKVFKYAPQSLEKKVYYENALDALSHAYYAVEDFDNCCKYGTEVLYLRHNELLKNVVYPELGKAKQEGKKIISFSLFGGDNPKYIESAVLNVELVNRIYPNWICRFYIDESISENVIKRLAINGTEIIRCDSSLNHIPKTMWRFLALDDDDVSCVIFRDADSVISPREASSVEEWLASDKAFHTIRDNGSNTHLVMAGLWGARCGVLPNIRQMIEEFVAKGNLDKRFADQHFLMESLWKYIVQSLYATDSIFNFLEPHPFKGPKAVDNFVARVENMSKLIIEGEWEDGKELIWRLYSQIDPYIADNYDEFNLLDNERLICEYRAVSHNKKLSLQNLPRRYIKNFKFSRIEIIDPDTLKS